MKSEFFFTKPEPIGFASSYVSVQISSDVCSPTVGLAMRLASELRNKLDETHVKYHHDGGWGLITFNRKNEMCVTFKNTEMDLTPVEALAVLKAAGFSEIQK
jgi:hypothetical protein